MNCAGPQGHIWKEPLSVSIIVPAFNEEKNIEDVLVRIHETLQSLGIQYEIVVVDDGSTDKTRFLAERHKVTVVLNKTNKGKGFALKHGFQKAIGEIIVTMDADGSHQPEEIPNLLKPLIGGADVVAGSRFLGRREKGSVKSLNILGNRLFNLLILLLTGRLVTDSQTGFRAYRKKVITETEIISNGYEVETEITVKTLKNGYKVQEEPITCEKRKNGFSKLNMLYDGIRIISTILKTRLLTSATERSSGRSKLVTK